MKKFSTYLSEKKLTPAEKKKREEVAKAIERDNPNMPMDKKMAIATATAKKVAESPEAWKKWQKTPAGKRYAALSPAQKKAKAERNRMDEARSLTSPPPRKDPAVVAKRKAALDTALKAISHGFNKTRNQQRAIDLEKRRNADPGFRARVLQKAKAKRANEEVEPCCEDCKYDHVISEATYQGQTVKLNDPIRTNEVPTKKFKVYVKDGDKVKVVRFGDPGLSIKRDNPERRKSFRARHNCDNPGPKTKARYWSCYQWRSGAKVDN